MYFISKDPEFLCASGMRARGRVAFGRCPVKLHPLATICVAPRLDVAEEKMFRVSSLFLPVR